MRSVWWAVAWAVIGASAAAGAGPLRSLTVSVDGVERTALVYAPAAAATRPAGGGAGVPLVFVYHGHGSTAELAERRFGVDRLWPAAVSVYPQGVATPGPVTDPAGLRAGWQHRLGDVGDRDVRFFDALLARVRHDYLIDDRRVYVTGHSNGGGFAYLLWEARPAVFAAVGPCSAGGLNVGRLTPKPAIVCGGLSDTVVPFDHQRRAMEAVRRLDGCGDGVAGEPWGDVPGATVYRPAGGATAGPSVVTYVYAGGHPMDRAEAGLIVRFFRDQGGGGPTTRP